MALFSEAYMVSQWPGGALGGVWAAAVIKSWESLNRPWLPRP